MQLTTPTRGELVGTGYACHMVRTNRIHHGVFAMQTITLTINVPDSFDNRDLETMLGVVNDGMPNEPEVEPVGVTAVHVVGNADLVGYVTACGYGTGVAK
jgi:hypothetical protein